MTHSPSPQSLATVRPRAEKVAAATALVNAFGHDNIDPSLRVVCEEWLTGDATFFGLPMHGSEKAHRALYSMMAALGVDVDAMERHYFTLIG